MSQIKKLWNKDFFLLWQGQVISQMGTQAFKIAMMFWVKHTLGSASIMGFLLMVTSIPTVIFGPIGGTFADWHSRRKILIACDLMSGVSVLGLVALLFFRPEATTLIVACFFLVSGILGTAEAFFRPAIQAAIPDIVPPDKVPAANAFQQGSLHLSLMAGQSMGGLLYRFLGGPVLLLFDGLSYLFSALSEMFIKIPQPPAPTHSKSRPKLLEALKQDTLEGFKYAWLHEGFRSLFLVSALLNFFIGPYLVLLPFYVEDVLMGGVEWYGFLLAGLGLGGLIGYMGAGALRLKGQALGKALPFSLILLSIGFALAGFLTHVVQALVVMTATGAALGFFNLNVLTLIQTRSEERLRGRLLGLMTTIGAGLIPISMGFSGVIADLLDQNVTLIFKWCGFLIFLVAFISQFYRPFREFLAFEPFTEEDVSADSSEK